MDALEKAGEIGYTLGQHHHRLLVEDIMGLKVGTDLILLIHQDHNLLSKEKDTWCWSKRIKSIGTSNSKHRCNYVKYQTNLYDAMKVTVTSDPRAEELHNSIYTKNEIKHGCTKQ